MICDPWGGRRGCQYCWFLQRYVKSTGNPPFQRHPTFVRSKMRTLSNKEGIIRSQKPWIPTLNDFGTQESEGEVVPWSRDLDCNRVRTFSSLVYVTSVCRLYVTKQFHSSLPLRAPHPPPWSFTISLSKGVSGDPVLFRPSTGKRSHEGNQRKDFGQRSTSYSRRGRIEVPPVTGKWEHKVGKAGEYGKRNVDLQYVERRN